MSRTPMNRAAQVTARATTKMRILSGAASIEAMICECRGKSKCWCRYPSGADVDAAVAQRRLHSFRERFRRRGDVLLGAHPAQGVDLCRRFPGARAEVGAAPAFPKLRDGRA